MRILFLSIVFFLFGALAQPAQAQQFGNEWINYNQSYLKFGVYKNGLYRIPASALFSAGFPSSLKGENILLIRNGIEIPVFVSNSSTMQNSDFVEFYGEKADGILDTALYLKREDQLNPSMSLLSDTAYYFISYNSSSSNKRFAPRANTISNPPIKESYFWDKITNDYRNTFASGPSYFGNGQTPVIYLNSSQYEKGEGFAKSYTQNNDSVTLTLTSPYILSGGPFATFKTYVSGNSYLTTHRIKVFANNNEIGDSTFNNFAFKHYNLAVPMSYVNAQNKIVFKYTPLNSIPSQNLYDRYGISHYELRYPRLFDFGNASSFYFELDPKVSNYYLEISNFNHGGVAPKLYDMSSNEYSIGDISTPGVTKFLLPPSNEIKKLLLVSNASSTIESVSNLQTVVFKNYSQANNQGDYIMLSHGGYINDGSNAIQQYKNYRATTIGGAYNPVIVDVNDVYNEFGYGYPFNPMAIRNFLHYSVRSTAWSQKPKHAFILGKGIAYYQYKTYANAPFSTYPFYAIPGYGEPCSDELFTDFDKNNIPQLSIGRLPIMQSSEVLTYLEKIKDHEQVIFNNAQSLSDSILWQKRILHLAGTKNAAEQAPILSYLNTQKNIISSGNFGGVVTTLAKSSTSEVEDANSKLIDDMFNSGVGMIQFFGHSSASGMDYNLDFPSNYKNYKRYPLFIANGCGAGNIFILNGQKSLGEQFVFAPNKGSIAFIASVNTGLSGSLGLYTDSMYLHFSNENYGKSLGDQMNATVKGLIKKYPFDNLLRLHTEQIVLNGDPATFSFHYAKPDYAVEQKGVQFLQTNLTTTLDSLDLNIAIHNLGKFTNDSVSVIVRRFLPNNIEYILYNQKITNLSNSDTIHLKVPTYGDVGLGINTIEVSIDDAGLIDETSELNNKLSHTFTIYNDDLVPVFPYNESIIGYQGITFKASTLNPFAENATYVFQLDTTAAFNSPLLLTHTMESVGGALKWQPVTTLRDSTVYYWRTAKQSTAPRWSTSSFIYIANSLTGWNQSHYHQFLNNSYYQLSMDSSNRQLVFDDLTKKLQVQNVNLNGPSPFTYEWSDYLVKLNGSRLYTFGCDKWPGYASLQFIVIDTLTGKPWENVLQGTTGRFGSFIPCREGVGCQGTTTGINCIDPFFDFGMNTAASRKKIIDFIDSIPEGFYVAIQPFLCVGTPCGTKNTTFIKQWMSDTTTLGSNQSLYHKLKGMGFTAIDSFYKNRPFTFWCRKNRPNTIQQFVGADSTIKLFNEFNYTSYLFEGAITSSIIGPASTWGSFVKKSHTIDAQLKDSVTYDIYGIDTNKQYTKLATVIGDTSLSFINASQYPYLQLVMNNSDNSFSTPQQLDFWRVYYQAIPEVALAPNRMFDFSDTLGQGQIKNFNLAIENLSTVPMDSLLVKYEIIDKNSNRIPIKSIRFKPVPEQDTIHTTIEINTAGLSGKNTLYIEANPNHDHIEQYHPNNIGYYDFYVIPDNLNPLVDVTFDGVHILDKDIVSSTPYIQITLKDDNKYLALDDTSLVSVYMRYPGDNANAETYIPYDGQILKFIPALQSEVATKNKATIEFKPTFTKDGDDYMLIVKAKDKSGNEVGTYAYKVGFEVITKSSISSILNYPNPFSTSTQFVFTLTGNEIPSQFKIQIFTATGKVVREISKAELGPLHIGRNITTFKWKGDDQFGKPLANGVYLYRVISSVNGTKMENYETDADKWIEKGFGKMYIMR
ncbi:MAG: C25 family cysteine peptidase [Chitinophagaceae bacterium]